MLNDRGHSPTQTLAGEQNVRTLCLCKTHNFVVYAWACQQKSLYYLYKEVTMEEPRDEHYHEDEHLTETERLELERRLLESAYENSFQVLTDEMTFDELLEDKTKFGLTALLAFDPTEGIRKHELENMIEHYVVEEKYERCAILKKILNEKYPETIISNN